MCASLGSRGSLVLRGRRLKVQKRFPVTNRNGEIRATEFPHHGKIDSYNFTLVIKKRTTRARPRDDW